MMGTYQQGYRAAVLDMLRALAEGTPEAIDDVHKHAFGTYAYSVGGETTHEGSCYKKVWPTVCMPCVVCDASLQVRDQGDLWACDASCMEAWAALGATMTRYERWRPGEVPGRAAALLDIVEGRIWRCLVVEVCSGV